MDIKDGIARYLTDDCKFLTPSLDFFYKADGVWTLRVWLQTDNVFAEKVCKVGRSSYRSVSSRTIPFELGQDVVISELAECLAVSR